MRKYYIAALILVSATFAAYPFLEKLALAERGVKTFGGEECLILVGLVAAVRIVQIGEERYSLMEGEEEEVQYDFEWENDDTIYIEENSVTLKKAAGSDYSNSVLD